MEGKRSAPKPSDLLQRIRCFTKSILVDLRNGRSPVVSINKFRNYCTNDAGNCFCSSSLPVGKEMLTLQSLSHAYRIDVLLRVLLIVQKLLQEKRHASKRDIYYMYPSLFSEQVVVDRAINDICILLDCSRHNLNVVCVGKGLVMGWIKFFEHGKKVDCMASPNTGQPIPVYVEEVQNIQGRGYPDIPTRRFLHLLNEKLCVPVYCLVDSDPYGFDILTTYRFGSLEMAYDAEFLRIPEMCWLGAFTSDSEKYTLPSQCLLALTAEDKKRTEAMLYRCYLQHEEPQWRLELEMMLEKGVKFEIEALSVHSLSFLSREYLPSKIQGMSKMDRSVKCW